MTLEEYQKSAMRTCNIANIDEMRTHARLGIISESGEIAGIFQKTFQGHKIDIDHLMRELGDLLWFCAELCNSYGHGLASCGSDFLIRESVIEMRSSADIKKLVFDLCRRTISLADEKADGRWEMTRVETVGVMIAIGRIADRYMSGLDEVARINIEKLLKRFPKGFEAERSLRRSEGDV